MERILCGVRCILFKISFLYDPLEDRQRCFIIHEIIPVISVLQMFDKRRFRMKLEADSKCLICSFNCFYHLHTVGFGDAGNDQTCIVHIPDGLMVPGRAAGFFCILTCASGVLQ